MQTLAWVVGFAFLPAGLAAAVCAGGAAPGANGCCSDNKCPACCLDKRESVSGNTATCTCKGCHGDAVVDDAKCTSDCKGFLTSRSDTVTASVKMMGCAMCYGKKTMCLNPVAKCNAMVGMNAGGLTIVAGKVNCPASTSGSASGSSTAIYRIASFAFLMWMISSKA